MSERLARPAGRPSHGLADGTVSLEQARPIVDLAKELQPEQIAQVEKELARSAGVRDADEIRRRARRLAHTDRQQAADKAMRMWRDRKLRTWQRGGMLHGEFELPPEGGAYLKTALEALTTYDSNTTPDTERRTKDQRGADALIELAKLATDHSQLPEWEGERPHVLVTVDLHTLTNPDNPNNHPAHIDHTGPVSADTALRICCDAGISRVLTDGPSLVLDVGRKQRQPATGTRRAIWLRDGGICRWPGCDNRIKHIHHITHWTRGGPTNRQNLAGVCWHHHHLLHEGGWNLTGNANHTLNIHTPNGTLHTTSDPPRTQQNPDPPPLL